MVSCWGRFIQADSLVPAPGNPQSLNRYAYVYNNPLRYVDRSGFEPMLPNPSAEAIMLGGLHDLGSLYVSQGRSSGGTRDSNHCGPANVAMAVNYVYWVEGRESRATLADAQAAIPAGNRAPTWWGGVAGATKPEGVVEAFDQLSVEQELGWVATRYSGGTLQDILSYLQQGYPVATLLVFGWNSAHYVTVVGFDPETKTVYYLDPATKYEGSRVNRRIGWQAWSEFNENWGGRVIWNRRTVKTYIVYSPYEFSPVRSPTIGAMPRSDHALHVIR
jgi:hypothetical protein